MLDRLFRTLVTSKNPAADDVLVEGLRRGTPDEQRLILGALLARKSVRGLAGVLGLYAALPDVLRGEVVANARLFHPAIREAARGADPAARLGAIALVADARQGRLAYVLGDALRAASDEPTARAAAAGLLAIARSLAGSADALRRGAASANGRDAGEEARLLADLRGDAESAIVRALASHPGPAAGDLVSAALCLADSPNSLALQAAREHARSAPWRRLQQPPEAAHAAAFLLLSTGGAGRPGFAAAFARVDAPTALDALARRSHWLADAQLAASARTIAGGAWFDASVLESVGRGATAADVARWIGASGLADARQDALLIALTKYADAAAKLAALRVAIARPRGASLDLLRHLLNDADERVARVAAREIVRRRPANVERLLLPRMASASPALRSLIGRAVAGPGFESFWNRFEEMPPATRAAAGRALFKLLPDATRRLGRRLSSGGVDERLKALSIAQELGLVDALRGEVVPLCAHPSARLRSKAVAAVGQIGAAAVDTLLERVMGDADPRVRANAIETMRSRPGAAARFAPILSGRARDGAAGRERANAIRALHETDANAAVPHLVRMLRDPRPEHRVSAMWALREVGGWRLLGEVARLAREDASPRVRQYAVAVLQTATKQAAVTPVASSVAA